VGIVLVFVGNILVGGFKGFSYSVWELMIFAATLLWAIETLVAKIALRDIPSDIVAGARMACGLFILIPLSVWRSGGIFSPALISPTAWMWTAIASLLLLGYVLTWYAALKRAPAIYVAALLTPATLITNILSAIFITHSVNWQLLASSALFITGLTLIIFYARYLTRHTFAASEQAAGSRVR
jgi:drug/metabolite transporter (DMT)-like permease